MNAFITQPLAIIPPHLRPPKIVPRRRRVPECAAKKLLVVDLQQLLRTSAPEALKRFSERVNVERDNSPNGTFVLYSSNSGYTPSMQSIKDANLVRPDAIVALNGSELYQNRFRTPDPYWAKTVRKDWEPKPVKWVVTTFFADHVNMIETNEDYELVFECKDKLNRGDLCQNILAKLVEMGLNCRVTELEDDTNIAVSPAAVGPVEAIGFCQMMLGIEETSTYVFGGDALVGSCVRGKANFGLCGSDSQDQWVELGNRIFISKENGAGALLDGVLHHAVF